jgi:hypothetical protein
MLQRYFAWWTAHCSMHCSGWRRLTYVLLAWWGQGEWWVGLLVWMAEIRNSYSLNAKRPLGRQGRVWGAVVCCHLLTLVPRSRIFVPWRWRRRRFTQHLNGATSQKMAFFIATAGKTSNLILIGFYIKCPLFVPPVYALCRTASEVCVYGLQIERPNRTNVLQLLRL